MREKPAPLKKINKKGKYFSREGGQREQQNRKKRTQRKTLV